MSKKPVAKSSGAKPKQSHHGIKEVHKLSPLQHATFAQISEAQVQLQNAKMNLLSHVATANWGYPSGHVLEFDPDVATGEVTVIMKGEAKSVAPDNNESKE